MQQKVVLAAIGFAIALLLMASWASAEELQTGTWTGTWQTELGSSAVEFDVRNGPEITMQWREDHSFTEIKLDNETLTFTVEMKPAYDCNLKKKKNGKKFEGECTNKHNDKVRLTMNAP